MKTLLVDGTNLSRGADYDPRFPEMEDRRALDLLGQLSRAAERMTVEVFFDGPARVGFSARAGAARVRFSGHDTADSMILGAVRVVRAEGRGVTVATQDGSLRAEVIEEGGRVIGSSELARLCG